MLLFKNFLAEYSILEIDEIISDTYGEIKADLVKRGINIPENDIWIAATAINYKFKLITFDEHFKNIRDLNIYKYE
jgi:predicted nucleic acid-binding protein